MLNNKEKKNRVNKYLSNNINDLNISFYNSFIYVLYYLLNSFLVYKYNLPT